MEPHSPLQSDEARGRAIRSRATTPNPGATKAETPAEAPARGLHFERYFTTPGVDPFDAVEWELRHAVISNEKGEKVFEQKDVEMPKFWSQTATNVVVSKYFRGHIGSPDR
jgi:ribonucleoside-diphosphate reductase alpha chain